MAEKMLDFCSQGGTVHESGATALIASGVQGAQIVKVADALVAADVDTPAEVAAVLSAQGAAINVLIDAARAFGLVEPGE